MERLRQAASGQFAVFMGHSGRSLKKKTGRTANQQKIGDFFGACMNEPAVEKLGAAPLKPALDEIAGTKSKNQLAALLAHEHLRNETRGLLFSFGSDQDFSDSSSVIAFATAGGLGLPDRDYYTKTDAKSNEIRRKYLEHVQHMLAMLGESGPDAQADAQSVMRIETALAQVSLTRVEMRNPYNLK